MRCTVDKSIEIRLKLMQMVASLIVPICAKDLSYSFFFNYLKQNENRATTRKSYSKSKRIIPKTFFFFKSLIVFMILIFIFKKVEAGIFWT